MRVVVTGHTGFIGSHVLSAIREAQPDGEILGISRNAAPGVDARVSVLAADLATNRHQVTEALRLFQPDAVINCAGAVGGDPEDLVVSHAVSTAALLRAVAETTPTAHFIQIGSSAEYAQAVGEPHAVTEDILARPDSGYGISKLAATQLVMSAVLWPGLRWTVLRLFNIIGPGQLDSTLTGHVLSLVADLPDSSSPVALGSLDMYRDFLDVRDAARAVTAALQRPTASGHVINVGSGSATRARDLVRMVLHECGVTGPIVETGHGSNRSARVDWQRADITKAASLLQWTPEISLADSIRALVAATRSTRR